MEMPQITGEIGRFKPNLPAPSTLCKASDPIEMSVCRVLLRHSAQLHDPSDHDAIVETYYERSAASCHYCHRTNYRVQKLKVTRLVDTDPQPSLTFTNQRAVKEATLTLLSRLPAGTGTICGLPPQTRAVASKRYANPFMTSGFTRSSSTASSHHTTTRTTRVSMKNATISAQ